MAFTTLAKSILADAEVLDKYISANKLPQPSFDVNGPTRTVFANKEVNAAHCSLLTNTHKLRHLAEGPSAPWMGTMNGAVGDAMTTALVFRFNIVDHVPVGSEIPFEEVASKCGLALRDFKIIVRYAMTNFIFCEPKEGFIAHTAASRVLVENKLIRALGAMGALELFPATTKV
jgi:hypothetical protein